MSENGDKKPQGREPKPPSLTGLAAWIAFLLTVLGVVYMLTS